MADVVSRAEKMLEFQKQAFAKNLYVHSIKAFVAEPFGAIVQRESVPMSLFAVPYPTFSMMTQQETC